jgi:hypothetical protein
LAISRIKNIFCCHHLTAKALAVPVMPTCQPQNLAGKKWQGRQSILNPL